MVRCCITGWVRCAPGPARSQPFTRLAFACWPTTAGATGDPQTAPDLPLDYLDQEPEDLGHLMDGLAMQQAHLLGHSDGGTIALLFAARYPRRVLRMVVAAAHIYNEAGGATGPAATTRSRYQRDAPFREVFQAMHGERSDRLVLRWLDRWLADDTSAIWRCAPCSSEIDAPTLVIQGELDEFAIAPACARYRGWDSRRESVADPRRSATTHTWNERQSSTRG